MLEKSSMQTLIADLAGPRGLHDSRESWLRTAARNAGISARMAKALWYGEVVDAEHKAARRVAWAAAQRRKETADNSIAAIAASYERIATALAAVDPVFHQRNIAAYRSLAAEIRRLHGLVWGGADEILDPHLP